MTICLTIGKLGSGYDFSSLPAWYSMILISFMLAFWLMLLMLPVYVIYLLISRPLKKVERAKQVLDIIEYAENKGMAPEQAIAGIYRRGDHRMGKKFDNMAFYVEKGMDMFSSLDTVPGLVPRELTSTLSIGRKTKNIKGLIPLCRELLDRHISRTRGILNYIILPCLFYIFILGAFSLFIVPKFQKIYAEMLGEQELPALTNFVFGSVPWLALVGNIQLWGMVLFIFLFSFGADFTRHFVLEYMTSYLFYYTVPWRRKRIQQSFAVSLATLLDSGVPEQEALKLAAESTANYVMIKLAEEGLAMMQKGASLTEVLSSKFDKTGELAWRFKNSYTAEKNKPNFVKAVTGWGSWLNARAFRQEQLVAHLLSTILIIFSAAFVGMIAFGMFLPLIEIVRNMAGL